MRIPIFFGWGKKGKVVGYLGIEKCPNCKNYSHFKLYEYANNFNLYFIPVAKWNKKLYLVCSSCDVAWELDNELKEEMLDRALRGPSQDIVNKIWDRVDEIVGRDFSVILEKDPENWVELMVEKCISELCDEFSDIAAIRELTLKYLQCSFDEDKAK